VASQISSCLLRSSRCAEVDALHLRIEIPFIRRRLEGGTVSLIELERNPFIETLVVKVDPFLNPASFLVSPT